MLFDAQEGSRLGMRNRPRMWLSPNLRCTPQSLAHMTTISGEDGNQKIPHIAGQAQRDHGRLRSDTNFNKSALLLCQLRIGYSEPGMSNHPPNRGKCAEAVLTSNGQLQGFID
jgi:hypothetical protein